MEYFILSALLLFDVVSIVMVVVYTFSDRNF
jgi:hypothetical protein